MDVLPPSIELLDAAGRRCNPRRRLERARVNTWTEADWDRVIVENVDLLAACLRQARLIADDSTLRVLGTQVDNIDIVLAEVSDTEHQDLRRLVLLEDKLLRNPEAKRKVLAQLLDYARVVQEDWPSANLVSKLPDNGSWVSQNLSELKRGARNADFLLVVVGDGIDDGMERLARRFSGHDDPLSLQELVLVSMALYNHDSHFLLIPHAVSAVVRSERELTIRVVVQDVANREVPAEVTAGSAEVLSSEERRSPPVRDEVVTFLRGLRDRLDGVFPGVPPTARPRKSLEFWQTAADGAKILCKIHFGGYERDTWSPIQVGVMVGAKDTAARDQWCRRFQLELGRLPSGTEIRAGGPRTVDVLESVPWTSAAELDESLAERLAGDLARYADVVKSMLAAE